MQIKIFNNKMLLAHSAAEQAASAIQRAIAERGRARIIAATGASQFEFLEALTGRPGVDWKKVEAFHLDEYVGLPKTHLASFHGILLERLINKAKISEYHFLTGDAKNLSAMVRAVSDQLAASPIDVAFVGIGENGHLAFNDPPADFTTEEPYIFVTLDEPCRRQQVNEGWFADLSKVPTRAISMSIRQIMKSKEIVAIVPDLRKAQAVKACMSGEITPIAPASILRRHRNAVVYLDPESASLMTEATLNKLLEESQILPAS
jgi:glucosamine-6-phosphate deaminase